jgi:hypothetical protein
VKVSLWRRLLLGEKLSSPGSYSGWNSLDAKDAVVYWLDRRWRRPLHFMICEGCGVRVDAHNGYVAWRDAHEHRRPPLMPADQFSTMMQGLDHG